MDKVDIRFPGAGQKGRAGTLPRNALERANVLVGLMSRLAAHLRRETAAVRDRRPGEEIAAMLQDKSRLVMAYEEIARLLRVDREGMAALPEELKERLREAMHDLADGAAENADTLRIDGEGQKLLVDSIVEAVNRARAVPQLSYGPGALAPAGRGYAPPTSGPATSATLNTRL